MPASLMVSGILFHNDGPAPEYIAVNGWSSPLLTERRSQRFVAHQYIINETKLGHADDRVCFNRVRCGRVPFVTNILDVVRICIETRVLTYR